MGCLQMSELLTEKQIRQMARSALHPKPWLHSFTAEEYGFGAREKCRKCGKRRAEIAGKSCPIPDPDPREFPVIVADLLGKVNRTKLADEIVKIHPLQFSAALIDWPYFIWLDPMQQAEILLRALGVEVPK